jgi:signal transduction histidine kinase
MPRPARILCVEDDPNQYAFLEKVLGAEGYDVILATDGVEAIDKALSGNPDLVLLDIRIPGLDGYEVALRIRSETAFSQIPIIAMTSVGDSATAEAVGCDEFLKKPIEIPRLKELMNRFLRGKVVATHPPPRPAELLRPEPDALVFKSGEIVEKLKSKIRELEGAHERIQAMEKSRAEFYRNISHELYTPLTPSMGYVALLLDGELGEINGRQRHALVGIDKSLARMKLLIENLLDATALQMGRLPINPSTFEAQAFLREVAGRMEERIRDKDIDLRVEVRPARVVKVHTDREKLGRILLHLLDNAVKFSPLGGVVAVSIHKDINGFSLHVLDAGEGVDEGEAANIFEPFYQLDGSVTRTHGGMGLGLAIVQRLAGALGGSVSVESPPRSLTPLGPGRGSLLSVRLPASVSPVPE